MFAVRAGDWALKRILKFVLKRTLRHIIKTQIDIDQLQLQLGQGTLELREVLLNTDYLNDQLGELPWEFTAAFVGSVAAVIPLASLYTDSCWVKLDEVFLTLRPRPVPASGAAAAQSPPAEGTPRVPAGAPPSPVPGAGAGPVPEWQGESAVAEGVKLIAGGLETLLQRMKVSATRVVLRLEAPAASGAGGSGGEGHKAEPPGCYVVVVSLAHAEYSGGSTGAGDGVESTGGPAAAAGGPGGGLAPAAATVQVAKSLRFSGLTVELQEPAATARQPGRREGERPPGAPPPPCSLLAGGGCSGAVDVRLSWGLRPHARPHVSLSAQLEPLLIHLRPEDVAAVAGVAAAAGQLPRSGGVAALAVDGMEQAAETPAPRLSQSLLQQHLHPPGSRSLIEGLMLPDCEGVVVEALQGAGASGAPWGSAGAEGITGQEEVDEFFDAKSLLGSLQSSCASIFASAHEGLAGSSHSFLYAAPPGGPAGPLEASLFQAHDLAASVRQLSAEEPLEWEVSVLAPALNLALLYPEPRVATSASPSPPRAPGSGPGGPAGQAHHLRSYAPRLSVDLSGLAVAAAGGPAGAQLAVTVRQLEASEQLVVAGTGPGLCGEEATPEEVARVPCVLPPLGYAPRPFSSTAGSAPLPPANSTSPRGAGSGGLSATLSQLSDLQASVYHSALQASSGRGGVEGSGGGGPRLLVLPVLSCGGCGQGPSDHGGGGTEAGGQGEGGSLPADVCALLHVGVPAAGAKAGQVQGCEREQKGVAVTAALQPLTVWASVPLAERLRAFLEAVQAGVASAQDPAAAGPSVAAAGGAGNSSRCAAPASGGQQGAAGPGAAKAAVSAAIDDILQDLRELRMDAAQGAAAPAAPAPLRVRTFLPHVCLVASIPLTPHQPPAPTSHGYTCVAADLGVRPWQGAAVVQGLRRLGAAPRVADVQAMLERLPGAPSLQLRRSSEARPDLRSGGQRGAREPPAERWDATLAASTAALFLVGAVEGGADSVLGGCLFAHQVCAAVPASTGCGNPAGQAVEQVMHEAGLLVDVQWRPGNAAPPTLLPDAWHMLSLKLQQQQLAKEPSEEQGRWESDGLDAFTFRQQCVQTSPLHARISAPRLEAALSPAALAALANFADGLLQLAPQPPEAEEGAGGQQAPQQYVSRGGMQPGSASSSSYCSDGGGGGSGVQVAVELEECSVQCQLLTRLAPWHAPPGSAGALFSVEAQGLQLVSAGNLSGVPGASALVLSCEGLDLRRGSSGGGACLVHRPAGVTVDGRATPGLELMHIARPQGRAGGATPCLRLHPRTGRYFIPTDAQAAITLAGWTLATEDGDISLGWLSQLGALFALPSALSQGTGTTLQPPAPLLAAAAAGSTSTSTTAQQQQQQQQQQPSLEWALEGLDLALRYEPPASALGGLAALRDPAAAAVVVGSAACSGGRGRPGIPLSLRCLALQVARCEERGGDWSPAMPRHATGVALGAAGYVCVATEGELTAELPVPEGRQPGLPLALEVRNHLLNIKLTQHSTALLQQLGRQWGDAARQAQQQGCARGAAAAAGGVGPGTVHPSGSTPRPPPTPAAVAPGGPCGVSTSSSSDFGRVAGSFGGSSGGAAGLLRDVQDDAYRPLQAREADRLRQASILIDGGWYEALDNEPLSPAGSPPVLIDNYFATQQPPLPAQPPSARSRRWSLDSWAEDVAEGDGMWFDAGPSLHAAVQREEVATSAGPVPSSSCSPRPSLSVRLQQPAGELPASLIRENYLDKHQGTEAEPRRLTAALSKCGPGQLPAGYPQPSVTVTLRDINISVTLCSMPHQEGPPPATSSAQTELQLRMQRLCVQADLFPEGCHHVQRLAVRLHLLDIREHREPFLSPLPTSRVPSHRAGHVQAGQVPLDAGTGSAGGSSRGASPGACSMTSLCSSMDWRQVLGQNASLGPSRDPEACMVAAVVEAVRPDPQGAPGELEYRVEVQLLPLRLQLEQGTVAFLQHFFAPLLDTLGEPGVMVEHEDAQAGPADFDEAPADGPLQRAGAFIQRCEVQPFTITIDYQPHSVDISALRRGDLTEILNLFPWGGVTLQFRHMRLFGVHDAGTLGTALASAWLEDIVKYQVHKFLAGIAPIRSLCKVSSAAVQLVTIPVEHLFAESSGPANHRSLSSLADANFLRQMRRGMLSLVRAIATEALGLGATVAGGAQVALPHRRASQPSSPG